MDLAPGTSLQHFRLAEKIGEGAMGAVWRAVDTTLDREVAIKVLPSALAGDPDRVARFEREAKALAALNHQNIAAIYGFSATPVRFLALELVRGEDFAAILDRGPLAVREAIDAARQVAAALEAAHDGGIVHRDLKPANVKRTPEGVVKVLDFGLAKALESERAGAEQLATVTSAGHGGMTLQGVVLGTASYMSPEQARGLPVDRRTDLWAFGCLLYEMLTGVRAFDGATVTDVLVSVVRSEPDWEKLPPDTPLPVRRLLRRCLEKDPRKRLRDAGDASLLLDDNPEDARRVAPAPVTATRLAHRHWPLYVAVPLVVALAASLGWWKGHAAAPARAAAEVAFHRVTYARGSMRAARFAHDGRTIAYSAAWDGPPIKLYLTRSDSRESTPLALPPGELLSVSRDGELAVSLGHAYQGWMGDGTLARVPLLGGSPRELLDHVRSADWSPDGASLAVVRRVDGADQLEYPAGKPLYRTAGYIADVRVGADGSHVAFTDHPVYGDDRGEVAIVDREGHKTTLDAGFDSVRGVAWSPDGREVWHTGLRGEGATVLAASDLAGHTRTVYASVAPIELFDVAPDGRALLGRHVEERQVLAQLEGFREPRYLPIPGESSLSRSVTADGRMALVSDQIAAGYATYLVRSDRPSATRLATGDGTDISLDDATALVVSSDSRTLYTVATGIGGVRAVPNPEGLTYDGTPAWMPDGRHVVTSARRRGEAGRGMLIDVATGAGTPFCPPGQGVWFGFSKMPISPDGRFVVLDREDGTPMRWPVSGGSPLAIPGLAPGDEPIAWSSDGQALFITRRAVPVPVERLDLASGHKTPWLTITPHDVAGLRIAVPTITANGRYWTLSTARLLTDLYVVEGLR